MIKNIEQTCLMCPSQWEGELYDGRLIYIRYRWGRLTAQVFHPGITWTDDWNSEENSDMIVDKELGDDLDGVIEWDEVLPYISEALELLGDPYMGA